MNVNTHNTMNNINNVSAINGQTQGMEDKIAEKKEMMQKQMEEQNVDISQMGRVSSFMSGLSATEKSAVADFNKSVQSAKKSGNFDATALAKEAPEAINQLAQQLNVSTEEMLSNMTGNGIQGMISGSKEQSTNSGINAYLDVSSSQKSSDSILDLFSALTEDEEQEKSSN